MMTTEPLAPAERNVRSDAQVTRARRRALMAIGAVVLLLVVLWFGDAIAGLLPTAPFAPTTHAAGDARITLALNPTLPRVGQPIAARLTINDAAHQPITGATLTYHWEMVSMDMGLMTGQAQADAHIPGAYAAQVTPSMGGLWRLTVTLLRPNHADTTTSYDIRVHN